MRRIYIGIVVGIALGIVMGCSPSQGPVQDPVTNEQAASYSFTAYLDDGVKIDRSGL